MSSKSNAGDPPGAAARRRRAAGESRRRKAGVFGWTERVLDTKTGATVVGFLLTAVIGALVTGLFTEGQKARDRSVAEAGEQMKVRDDFRTYVGQYLIGRKTRATVLQSALSSGLPKSDVESRWAQYQEYYTKYNELSFSARSSFDELKPSRYIEKNKFTASMDEYISPSFSRIDRCLTSGYSEYNRALRKKSILGKGYDPSQDDLDYASRAATAKLSNCGVRSDGSAWAVADETSRLHACLMTFVKELEDSVWLSDMADREGARPFWTRLERATFDQRRTDSNGKPLACKRHDYECWRKESWKALQGKIDSGCAHLQASEYRNPI